MRRLLTTLTLTTGLLILHAPPALAAPTEPTGYPQCGKEWVAKLALMEATGLTCGGIALANPMAGSVCGIVAGVATMGVDTSSACDK
jgi:hypothetical protein